MKKHLSILAAALGLLAMAAIAVSPADEVARKPAPAKATMAEYMIIAPHTPEECLKVLDEQLAMGPQSLAKWEWGCMAGDHTGYAIVEAASDSAAAKMVPAEVQAKAKIVKLNKFTAEQIKSFHEKK